MDRRVKERLVGASILVVLIVLIVPELLSGPPTRTAAPRLPVSAPASVRNVTVDLATSKAPEPVVEAAAASSAGGAASAAAAANAAQGANAGPATAAGDAEGGAQVPLPASPPPAAAPSAVSPPPALESDVQPPTSKKATARAATPAPVTPGHGWAVQLGSFASRANADKLVRQLRTQGFGVYVLAGGAGAGRRYRVRVGPMADRNAAIQAEAKLKASGHVGSLAPPSP